MRGFLLAVVLCCSGFAASAQAQIFNVTTIPSYARCDDNIYAVVDYYWLNCTNYQLDSTKFNRVGSTLDLDFYWHVDSCITGGTTVLSDTVFLGKLPQGTYNWDITFYDTTAVAGTYTFGILQVHSCCEVDPTFSYPDTIGCQGDTATFIYNGVNALGMTWYDNWANKGTDTILRLPLNSISYRQISLVGDNGSCKDTVSLIFSIKEVPVLDSFIAIHTNQDVQFNDQSGSYYKLQYYWNFGDGDTSHSKDPMHSYSATGTYNVCEAITNFCATDTVCIPQDVDCPVPVINFTYSIDSHTVTIVDSSAPVNIWFWSYGDGAFTGVANPAPYTYANAGVYDLCLHVTNDCGLDSICYTIVVGDTTSPPDTGGSFARVLNVYGLDVYPNPFSGSLKIDGLPAGQFTAIFHDVLGRRTEAEVVGGRIVTEIPEGAYVLEIIEAGEPVWRGRVLKQ